jgi:heme/copper-type cytochrome/quinol oxidase subunit 2
MLRSLLLWILLTAVVSVAVVFRPGLDLAKAHDDYQGYWDFRLAFFMVIWVPISLPVWALATYVVAKFK